MKRIGSYEVVDELGRGAAGAVYRVRELSTGREFAIKALLCGRQATDLQLKRFEREARALRKVDHPHVARLVDAGVDQNLPYLVLELHSGGTLEEAIRRGPLPIVEVVRLGLQLASALEAAHAQGVLHRDIKPGNVLQSGEGRATLTDFGLAKDLHRQGQTQQLTKSGIFLGSPGYWAPEQAEGRLRDIGPTTDVYGLGAVLYEALAGRPPIVAEGLIGHLKAASTQRPPRLRSLRPEVPAALEAVVLRCLEKEPQARYSSARELRLALEASLEAGPNKFLLLCFASLLLVGLASSLAAWRALGSHGVPGAAPVSPAPSEQDLSARGLALLEEERYGEAAQVLRPAAEAGDPRAALALATLYLEGQGLARDRDAARSWLEAAAAGGQLEANWRLARLLLQSGPDRDPASARSLLTPAAAGDHVPSLILLGWLLTNEEGGPPDLDRAVDLWRRASALGSSEALVRLGQAHQDGLGRLPVDEAEALRLYRQAAEAGSLPGMFKLGTCYENGIGVEPDPSQAVTLYRQAAEAGQIDAMAAFARACEFGAGGAPLDHDAAFAWYRKAAAGGSLIGEFGLGRCYLKGRGVEQDLRRSAEHFTRAAEQGHTPSMVALGGAYERGSGLPLDAERAERWFRRAASLGNPDGIFRLALLLARGSEKDLPEVEALLRRGVALGHVDCMDFLGGVLVQRGEGAEAVLLFRRAAGLGYHRSMNNLGVALLRGVGGPADPLEARRWFEIVAREAEDPELKRTATAALKHLSKAQR